MKTVNVCFLMKDGQVLLAMKKRGFGVGKWNGVGGKVKEGESVEEATVREAEEEIGVRIDPKDLEKVAEIVFHFPDKEDWDLVCHAYFTRKWEGEPKESEEMAPRWFTTSGIPLAEMWSADTHWFPQVLAGKKLKANFYFKGAGESVLKHDMQEIADFY
jgi:ADP-ribose pyrophosphatase YjhB (NUDIX family)